MTDTGKLCSAIETRRTDFERWADERQLRPEWDSRARMAADYIPSAARVLDLGCGRMTLEQFLPPECTYIPCDLMGRDERTIVCDFNAGTYPDIAAATADIVSVLGVLEYVFDPSDFLAHLREWRRPVVMSYCATDGIGDPEHRRSLGWVNDFSYHDLERLFTGIGFSVQCATRIDPAQWLFRLLPETPVLPTMRRVAVLSYNNVGNFGDRLGYHLINDVLPAHAEVTFLNFVPWVASNDSYDLVVVGFGNSLFGNMVDDNLLSLVDRSRHAIGIFGTQYHETISGSKLDTLVRRLEHWYARFEDDVLRYGRGMQNVSHLGDWLISAFPMSRPTTDERLKIGEGAWEDRVSLDRTIQNIQQYSTVFSTRLHPLLCALTSADTVGYQEQREHNGLTSGKFRAMLIDVFG